MSEQAKPEIRPGQTWEAPEGKLYHVIGVSPTSKYLVWVIETSDGQLYHENPNGYCLHKLIKDEDGNPVEPEEPKVQQVERPVVLNEKGDMIMKCPIVPTADGGIHAVAPARQGTGFGGWTCVGFRFKLLVEPMQQLIFPNALAWANENGTALKLFKAKDCTMLTIADKAVWWKLGG